MTPETDHDERAAQDAETALIAAQNDRFRKSWGQDATIPGKIVMTKGVAALGPDAHIAIMFAVQNFADFSEDNDPYGHHDFGAVPLRIGAETITIWWKLDLYDPTYTWGSDAPADPTETRRVMTLLLPSEY